MTYEKEKKVVPLIEEQFGIWRKSKRSIARLDEPEEAQLVAVVGENLGQIIELTSSNLRDWLGEDPRSSYGHTYVGQMEDMFGEMSTEMEAYARNTTLHLEKVPS